LVNTRFEESAPRHTIRGDPPVRFWRSKPDLDENRVLHLEISSSIQERIVLMAYLFRETRIYLRTLIAFVFSYSEPGQ
jgi:hypothetical protein